MRQNLHFGILRVAADGPIELKLAHFCRAWISLRNELDGREGADTILGVQVVRLLPFFRLILLSLVVQTQKVVLVLFAALVEWNGVPLLIYPLHLVDRPIWSLHFF